MAGNAPDAMRRDGLGAPAHRPWSDGPRARGDPWSLYRTIRYGVAGTGMPPHPLAANSSGSW